MIILPAQRDKQTTNTSNDVVFQEKFVPGHLILRGIIFSHRLAISPNKAREVDPIPLSKRTSYELRGADPG